MYLTLNSLPSIKCLRKQLIWIFQQLVFYSFESKVHEIKHLYVLRNFPNMLFLKGGHEKI